MTETILSLLPTFGLWIIYFTVALGGLALPLPGSMLVIASGSFASVGDFDIYSVMAAAYSGYLTGDQAAFNIARIAGPSLLDRFKKSPRAGSMIAKAQQMLQKRGVIAIFLSRTVISPIGPWMSYLCGAAGMKWWAFTLTSAFGASFWVVGYAYLGYYFADRLSEMAELANDGLGLIAAIAIAIGAAWWLRLSWKKYKEKSTKEETAQSAGDPQMRLSNNNADTL